MLAQALLGAAAAAVAVAQVPLASKRFEWNALPYQADQDDGVRGRQYGYNRCNSTTAGEDSRCQTAIINGLDDFCLWAPPEPGSVVGNVEGEMVAWCTQGDRHGARQIPAGALKGVQFMRTPNYVQVTGRIDQTFINIGATDDGGEMDPHGADQRGNPLGGLLFSSAFGAGNSSVTDGTSSNGAAYRQVVQWHNFMGANIFCLKACDPDYELGYRMCEHIYDRIGCNANAPAAYEEGVFETCLGDDQLPPGIYIGANGARSTYTQPGEGTVISTLPYVPAIPSSSSCTPYESATIYNAGAAVSASSASSAVTSGLSSATSAASSSAASASSRASSAASSAVTGVNNAASSRVSAASGAAASATSQPASGAGQLVPGGLLAVLAGLIAML